MADSNLEQLSEKRQPQPTQDLDLIVSLRADIRQWQPNPRELLTKNVAPVQEMSLGRILEYLLDSREDEFNPAYNQDEIRHANRIKDWRASANASPNSDHPDRFQIMYLGRDNQLSNPIEPSSYVSDHPDMVREEVKRTDFGEEVRYNRADLVARFIPGF